MVIFIELNNRLQGKRSKNNFIITAHRLLTLIDYILIKNGSLFGNH